MPVNQGFFEIINHFDNNNNDLNKNKKEIEAYLKEQGAAPQLITMLVSLICHYYLLNNEIAKHNDKVDPKYLEFLMYQTGVFIRMLVIVKKEEINDGEYSMIPIKIETLPSETDKGEKEIKGLYKSDGMY